MTYFYICTKKSCANRQEEQHSVEGFKEYQPKCEKCGSKCRYIYIPTIVQFALKDGPSGTAPSKAERVKAFRRKQYETVGKRQRDRYDHLNRDCVPNYDNKYTDNWENAKIEAMKDKGPKVAATYDAKIREEKKKSKKIII